MRTDGRGDIGFMEAMIAMMAVMTVLAAFLGLAAHAASEASDPTEMLDRGAFTGSVESGVFVPGYGDYAESFLDISGCSGISVSVSIPGGFCDPPEVLIEGDMVGDLSSRSFVRMVSDDSGRTFPVIVEVTVCA